MQHLIKAVTKIMSSSSNDPILFDSPWLQIKKRDDWYIYSHSPKSNGKGVVVLGYDFSGSTKRFLARIENCPVHLYNYDSNKGVTSLSGMIEPNTTSLDTAAKELYEEAGISIPIGKFIFLGISFGSKASDYCDYLYAVDLAGHNPIATPVGDGTQGEDGSFCIWMDEPEFFQKILSPTPALIYQRLLAKQNK